MARRRKKWGVTGERIAAAVAQARRGLETLDSLIDNLVRDYVLAQAEIANEITRAVNSERLHEARYRAMREADVHRILDRVNKATPLKARRVVTESVAVGAALNQTAGLFKKESAFSRVERQAINVLTDSLTSSLDEATRTVGRRVDDVYRREGLRLATLQLSDEQPRAEAAASLIDRLRRQGATSFVDKAGREWQMSVYAEMVVRTTSSEGVFQGTTTTMLARDFDLVEVNKVRDPCPKCAKYDGKTYSLTGRTKRYPKLGIIFPIHPNCRHFVTASIEAFAEREEWRAAA
jgi:hypothetical protein